MVEEFENELILSLRLMMIKIQISKTANHSKTHKKAPSILIHQHKLITFCSTKNQKCVKLKKYSKIKLSK